MKEVKPSKKPLAIYYAIVLAVLLLLNLVLVPWMSERQVEEVDYGTFMTMTEEKNIGRVDIESNQIIFTDKEEKQVYKTGLMNDPDLTQRLYDAGAQFSSEIVEQASPLMSFLLSFVWSGSAVFVGSFLSLLYWRLTKLWRWIVSLGMGAALILLLNAAVISGGFMDKVLAFLRWLGAAPLNLCLFLIGVAVMFAVFDWLLTRRAPITAATA